MPVQTRSGHAGEPHTFTKPPSPRRRKKTKEENLSGEHEAARHEEGHPGGVEPVKAEEEHKEVGEKREHEQPSKPESSEATDQLPEKKLKTEEVDVTKYLFHPGVIERGHIYFFYRPKVQHEEVHSLDDIKNLHMLLVPRPPEFSVAVEQPVQTGGKGEGEEMTLLAEGADVVPARETLDQPEKHYRLLTIGKKHLPEIEGGHRDVLWASVTAVGNDLHNLERGFGEKTYETKTRGVRYEGPARLAGRGVYSIVNKKGSVPSRNVTHLAYHLTHPSTPGEVQETLGIYAASSFVVQVKNPLAETPYAQRVGLPAERRAHYPDVILDNVFERGSQGRHPFGLRFTTCHCIDLLDYEGAELLLIAAGIGVARSDETLGEHRGEVLEAVGEQESQEPIEDVFKELAVDKEAFPAEPLEGHWI